MIINGTSSFLAYNCYQKVWALKKNKILPIREVLYSRYNLLFIFDNVISYITFIKYIL